VIGSNTQPGDVSLDQTVINGAHANNKGYMIGEIASSQSIL